MLYCFSVRLKWVWHLGFIYFVMWESSRGHSWLSKIKHVTPSWPGMFFTPPHWLNSTRRCSAVVFQKQFTCNWFAFGSVHVLNSCNCPKNLKISECCFTDCDFVGGRSAVCLCRRKTLQVSGLHQKRKRGSARLPQRLLPVCISTSGRFNGTACIAACISLTRNTSRLCKHCCCSATQ